MFRKYRVIALLLVGLVLSPTVSPALGADCQHSEQELDERRQFLESRVRDVGTEFGFSSPEYIAAVSKALETFPHDLAFLRMRVSANRENKEYAKALEDCNQVIAWSPQLSLYLKEAPYDYFSKAELLYSLKDYSGTINACDQCISSFPGKFRSRAYSLKSKALFKLGRFNQAKEAVDAFRLACFLSAVDGEGDKSHLREAASVLNQKYPLSAEQATSQVLKHQGTELVLLQLLKLSTPGALPTVADIEKTFDCDCEKYDDGKRVLWKATKQWERIELERDQDGNNVTVTLVPDPSFAFVGRDDIVEKFGKPPATSIHMAHISGSPMRYNVGGNQLLFSFSRDASYWDAKESSSLSSVVFHFYKHQSRPFYFESPSARSEKMKGTRTQELITWLHRLADSKDKPTLEHAELLFGRPLQQVRSIKPKTWKSKPDDANYLSDGLFVEYAPDGTTHDEAQLILSPGDSIYRISREDIEKAFGTGNDFSTNDRISIANRGYKTHVSYPTKYGSVSVFYHQERPKDSEAKTQKEYASRIVFWWRGIAIDRTLEARYASRNSAAILQEAQIALQKRDFESTRALLDLARHKAIASSSTNLPSVYEQLVRIKAGYVDLFKALNANPN